MVDGNGGGVGFVGVGGTVYFSSVIVSNNSLIGGQGNDQFSFLIGCVTVENNVLDGSRGTFDTFTVNTQGMGLPNHTTATQIIGGTGIVNPASGPVNTSIGHINALLLDDNSGLTLDSYTNSYSNPSESSHIKNIQEVVLGSAAGETAPVSVGINAGDITRMNEAGDFLFVKGDVGVDHAGFVGARILDGPWFPH